jgi:hypothetical protein
LSAGLWITWLVQDFLTLRTFSKPQTLRIVATLASTPRFGTLLLQTHTLVQNRPLGHAEFSTGSPGLFHWVTQSFLWITQGCSRQTALGTRQLRPPCHRLMGHTSRSGEPWQARLDVSSGIFQLPGFNTNKIRKYFTSIFQYVQESCSRLEFVDPEFLSCS